MAQPRQITDLDETSSLYTTRQHTSSSESLSSSNSNTRTVPFSPNYTTPMDQSAPAPDLSNFNSQEIIDTCFSFDNNESSSSEEPQSSNDDESLSSTFNDSEPDDEEEEEQLLMEFELEADDLMERVEQLLVNRSQRLNGEILTNMRLIATERIYANVLLRELKRRSDVAWDKRWQRRNVGQQDIQGLSLCNKQN